MANTFGEKVKQRRLDMGISQNELADKMGYSNRSMITHIESGITDLPQSKLVLLADILQVPVTYFFDVDEKSKDNARKVPLIGQIAAGTPIFAEQNIEDYFLIDPSIPADFCLRVKGDSMIDDGISDGDIVFIRLQDTVENGETAAFVIDGEATLKKFYKTEDRIVLQPANDSYDPIVIKEYDQYAYIAGKWVATLHIGK